VFETPVWFRLVRLRTDRGSNPRHECSTRDYNCLSSCILSINEINSASEHRLIHADQTAAISHPEREHKR
jgi:hypothetical protein